MSGNQLLKGIPVLDWLVRSTLGTQNQRLVRRYLKQVALVSKQEDAMRVLTDAQLMAKTEEFRARIAKGEKPFDLRPEIFAAAREAMDRAAAPFVASLRIVGLDEALISARATQDESLLRERLAALSEPLGSRVRLDMVGGQGQLLAATPAAADPMASGAMALRRGFLSASITA